MKRLILASFVAGLAFVAAPGCKEEPKPAAPPAPAPATPAPSTPTPAAPTTKPAAGGDVHDGPKNELGSKTSGVYTVKATQVGAIKPGAESVFELAITGGNAKPSAVRAWVGTEAGEGSAKSRAHIEGNDYDVHVDLPATLPAGSKLWVELETFSGKTTASFDLKQ